MSVLGKLFVGTRKGPSGPRVRQLKRLQRQIGIRFTDLALLEQALTHRSYSHVTSRTRNESNERMEFLGDSVLGLSVSQFLYLRFPERSEGALSKMKSLLVSRKVLSGVARDTGLGEYILLSGEESDMGGRDRASILADSFEGVIGAIYLDQGFRAANRFVTRFLLASIVDILDDEDHTNFKSLLQEYVQGKRLSHPVYRVRREEGPEHEKEYAIEVVVKGEVWGMGRGKSKKDAEQNAARAALESRQKGERKRQAAGRRPALPESPDENATPVPEAKETRTPRRGRSSRSSVSAGRAEVAPPETVAKDRGPHGIAASRQKILDERRQAEAESGRPERERPERERRSTRRPERGGPRESEAPSAAGSTSERARSPRSTGRDAESSSRADSRGETSVDPAPERRGRSRRRQRTRDDDRTPREAPTPSAESVETPGTAEAPARRSRDRRGRRGRGERPTPETRETEEVRSRSPGDGPSSSEAAAEPGGPPPVGSAAPPPAPAPLTAPPAPVEPAGVPAPIAPTSTPPPPAAPPASAAPARTEFPSRRTDPASVDRPRLESPAPSGSYEASDESEKSEVSEKTGRTGRLGRVGGAGSVLRDIARQRPAERDDEHQERDRGPPTERRRAPRPGRGGLPARRPHPNVLAFHRQRCPQERVAQPGIVRSQHAPACDPQRLGRQGARPQLGVDLGEEGRQGLVLDPPQRTDDRFRSRLEERAPDDPVARSPRHVGEKALAAREDDEIRGRTESPDLRRGQPSVLTIARREQQSGGLGIGGGVGRDVEHGRRRGLDP